MSLKRDREKKGDLVGRMGSLNLDVLPGGKELKKVGKGSSTENSAKWWE